MRTGPDLGMCMCMCVCIYIYMCIYVHKCTCIYWLRSGTWEVPYLGHMYTWLLAVSLRTLRM